MSQVGTVNIVNISICVTIALLFDSALVGGRESLVFTIQKRTPQHFSHDILMSRVFQAVLGLLVYCDLALYAGLQVLLLHLPSFPGCSRCLIKYLPYFDFL